jgi:hypothetical protein
MEARKCNTIFFLNILVFFGIFAALSESAFAIGSKCKDALSQRWLKPGVYSQANIQAKAAYDTHCRTLQKDGASCAPSEKKLEEFQRREGPGYIDPGLRANAAIDAALLAGSVVTVGRKLECKKVKAKKVSISFLDPALSLNSQTAREIACPSEAGALQDDDDFDVYISVNEAPSLEVFDALCRGLQSDTTAPVAAPSSTPRAKNSAVEIVSTSAR